MLFPHPNGFAGETTLIDIRYHIYSLAAVFFALAVGIAIGFSFATRQPATRAEQRTIHSYADSMRRLKRDIENAAQKSSQEQEAAKGREAFCQALLPIVLKGKLAWRNVAIIQTGDYSELTGLVKRTLEDAAGARVTGIIELSREFAFSDDRKIAGALADCGVVVPADKEPREKLLAIVADIAAHGTHSQFIPKFEEKGIAQFTGDCDRMNRLVVIIGGSGGDDSNSAELVDNELIAQLNRLGVTVVGCESSMAASSYVPSWQKMGIATVDDVDSAIGQVGMVCALNGEHGSFGSKSTADRLIPQTLE